MNAASASMKLIQNAQTEICHSSGNPGSICKNPPTIRIGGYFFTKEPRPIYTPKPGHDDLYKYAPILEAKTERNCRGFQDVTSDLQIKSPQININIDRDKASALEPQCRSG